MVVFSDGMYRWEERTESFTGRKRGRIGGGDVHGAALEELKQILESPDLKNTPAGSTPQVSAQDWQGAEIEVPREDHVQYVTLESAFNTHGNPKEPAGQSNLGYQVSSQKVLDPLKQWMKQYTSKRDGAVEESLGNRCYPEKIVSKP